MTRPRLRPAALLLTVFVAFGLAQPASARTLEGPAPVAAAVACFQSQARLASFAHISADRVSAGPSAAAAVYRLQFDRVMLETIRFTATAAGGTRAEIFLAESYGRAERAHFARARGAPLERCLAAAPSAPTVLAMGAGL